MNQGWTSLCSKCADLSCERGYHKRQKWFCVSCCFHQQLEGQHQHIRPEEFLIPHWFMSSESSFEPCERMFPSLTSELPEEHQHEMGSLAIVFWTNQERTKRSTIRSVLSMVVSQLKWHHIKFYMYLIWWIICRIRSG